MGRIWILRVRPVHDDLLPFSFASFSLSLSRSYRRKTQRNGVRELLSRKLGQDVCVCVSTTARLKLDLSRETVLKCLARFRLVCVCVCVCV